MTLTKAIEILNSLEKTLAPTMAASGTDAIKLGIEALQHMKSERTIYGYKRHNLLPGETKD